jgi:hypothetical protein
MNQAIKNEVYNRVNRLGDNEWLLAYNKSTNKTATEIAELCEEFRKPFTDGRVASVGSAVFASPEAWQQIAAQSEAAAKRELLSGSSELAELDRLQKAATEATKAAEAKQAALSQAWREYNSIPDRVEAISTRLAEISAMIESLDMAKLEAEYKDAYRAVLNGALADRFALIFAASEITTAALKREVLNELSADLNKELTELKTRSKQIAKKLTLKG